jgi:hypothetical protein
MLVTELCKRRDCDCQCRVRSFAACLYGGLARKQLQRASTCPLDFHAPLVAFCYVLLVDITLQQALDALRRNGALEILEDVIREVYAANADRHDPAHGDDSGTFAQLVWRNIANLAFRRLQKAGHPVKKVAGGAIELISGPWVLRIYKLPLVAPDKLAAKLEQISWEGSSARLRGAVVNSSADSQLTLDREPDWAESFAKAITQAHVRVMHTGDPETGSYVIEIGLPRDNREGGSPWLDGTAELHNNLHASLPAPQKSAEGSVEHDDRKIPDRRDEGERLPAAEADNDLLREKGPQGTPDYSDLAENPLPLRRRSDDANEKPKEHGNRRAHDKD